VKLIGDTSKRTPIPNLCLHQLLKANPLVHSADITSLALIMVDNAISDSNVEGLRPLFVRITSMGNHH